MAENPLLDGVLSELAPPTLLIAADRHILYASPAFSRLTGLAAGELPCDAFLAPALSSDCGACCWSSLEAYLDSGEPALWNLRYEDGIYRPVLCKVGNLDISGRPLVLTLTLFPLEPLISPLALSLFRCMRRGLPDAAAYRECVAGYFRTHFGLGTVTWYDSDRDLPVAPVPAPTERASYPFDLLEPHGRHGLPRHVFPMPGGPGGLLVGDTHGQLDRPLANALATAVRVGAEAPVEADALDLDAPALTVAEALTPSERVVLASVGAGFSDKDIARRRGVSVHTVRNQVRAIMRKTGVNKRTRLVALSMGTSTGAAATKEMAGLQTGTPEPSP